MATMLAERQNTLQGDGAITHPMCAQNEAAALAETRRPSARWVAVTGLDGRERLELCWHVGGGCCHAGHSAGTPHSHN